MQRFICIIFIAGLFSGIVRSEAAVIKVFPGGQNLHQAIEKALPGDILQLQPGVFKEHDINVNKTLTITGLHFPIIEGENAYQLFIISADGVVIDGLQIQNTGRSSMSDMAGVKIIDARNVRVRYNLFYNNTYAVYIQNGSNEIITDNYIHGTATDEINSGNGVHGWKCDHLTVRRNTITGHRDGIYFEFVTESQIIQNKSFDNVRYGLHFMFSHHDTYTGNLFSNNGAGVAVMFSRGVEMYGNTFSQNWGDASYGILLKEISDSKIGNNLFTRNTVGIYMEGATRIHTWNNNFLNNGWAMRIQASCAESSFEHNNFIGNTFDVATNGTLVLNKFDGNYWDKYDGYDLDKNKTGDVPYYPVSLFSVVTEKTPTAMILFHSLLSRVMDQAEKVMPSIIPDQLRDNAPLMRELKN
jgi:nitrous oxidase accessory protein